MPPIHVDDCPLQLAFYIHSKICWKRGGKLSEERRYYIKFKMQITIFFTAFKDQNGVFLIS